MIGERGKPWTKDTHLPGGDFPVEGLGNQFKLLEKEFSFLDPSYATRLVRTYGTKAASLLKGVSKKADLGICFGADLYQKEVEYLKKQEWACSAEDVLFRRTKLGINFSKDETDALRKFMDET